MKKRFLTLFLAVFVLFSFTVSNLAIVEETKAESVYSFSQNAPTGNGYLSTPDFPYQVTLDIEEQFFSCEFQNTNWLYDDATTKVWFDTEYRSQATRNYTCSISVLNRITDDYVPMGYTIFLNSYPTSYTLENNVLTVTFVYSSSTSRSYNFNATLFDRNNCLPVFKITFPLERIVSYPSSVLGTAPTLSVVNDSFYFGQTYYDFTFSKINGLPFIVQSLSIQAKFGIYNQESVLSGIPQNNLNQYGFFTNISNDLEIKNFPATTPPTYCSFTTLTNISSFKYRVFPRSVLLNNQKFEYAPQSYYDYPCFVIDFSQMNMWASSNSGVVVGVGNQLADYQICEWYDIPCLLGNALLYFMYDFPLTAPIITFFQSVYDLIALPFTLIGDFSTVPFYPLLILSFLIPLLFYIIK